MVKQSQEKKKRNGTVGAITEAVKVSRFHIDKTDNDTDLKLSSSPFFNPKPTLPNVFGDCISCSFLFPRPDKTAKGKRMYLVAVKIGRSNAAQQ